MASSDPHAEERQEQRKEAEAHKESIPEGEIIYRSVRQDGEYTLRRPSSELVWSGVAAGLSMGFSLAGEGLLKAHVPEATWAPLITKFGYALGFLMVILGRQELFTEQTLTAMLPLFAKDNDHGALSNVARVWIVILIANLVGTAGFALAAAWTPLFTPEVQTAFDTIGRTALSHSGYTVFIRGIAAGFLIATMVWLLPGAGAARLWTVLILAYIVGVGELSHVIAGSSECLYVVFRGGASFGEYVFSYLLPSLIGNSIGGVALVAALAHVQHAPG